LIEIEKQPNFTNIDLEDLLSTRLRVKVLKWLVQRKESNISSIVKGTNSNHQEILKILHYFKEINLIEEKTYGRIRILRLKTETLVGKLVYDFFSAFQ
jgi:predicted transcriptional regulator